MGMDNSRTEGEHPSRRKALLLQAALDEMAVGKDQPRALATALHAALRRCADVLRADLCGLMRPTDDGDLVAALTADGRVSVLPGAAAGKARLVEPVDRHPERPLLLVVETARPEGFCPQDAAFHSALAGAIRDRLALPEGAGPPKECGGFTGIQWQIIELTNELLGHQGPDVDAHIEQVLARIGPLVGVERSYVIRQTQPGQISVSHEWAAPGVPPSRDLSQGLPMALLDPWQAPLDSAQPIIIDDVEDLPKGLAARSLLQAQGIKAVIAAPMRRNGTFEGLVGFDATIGARTFGPDALRLLQAVAHAIAVVLHRRDAELAAAAAQAQLVAESDRLSAMLAAVPDLVLELDAQGRCLACNTGPGQGHLLLQEKPVGKRIERLLPAPLLGRFRKVMKEVRGDGVRRSFDYDQEIDGVMCSCNAHIARRKDIGPQDGWFVVLRDVTRRRAQQRRIAQLSKIVELTSHLVIITDADANIEWVNPAFEQRSGWRLDEIRGRKPESFLRSRRASRLGPSRVEYALRGGVAPQTEIVNHDKAGEEYWVSMDVQPLLDENGCVQGFVSVQTDITELKRKHSREIRDWKLAIEGASDGIAMLNVRGQFQFMNHAYRDMFGIPDSEPVKALRWTDFYPGEGADWFATRAWRQMVGARALRMEVRGQHRDGGVIRQELSLNTRLDGGLLVIARDITDRARADAEKARLRDQLQVAQQREMIAHVAAGIAHDLHNVFAVVSGTASMLEQSCGDSEDALSGIRRIKRAAQMAVDLGAGLATLGRDDAHPLRQDLREIVRQGVDLLGTARIDQHGIVPRLPERLQPVWADSTKLLQVIVNLALNACEADPARATAVRVEVLPSESWIPPRPPDTGTWSAGRRYSVFQVADDGPGVGPEDRARLFEPYFTTKGKSGTGLGLTIVGSIVQQSDAALWFDSTPGQGTTVTVAWPQAAPAPVLLAAPRAEARAEGTAPNRLDGRSILVVDDVADMADTLAEMLEAAGAQTVALSDPREAEALLRDNPGQWSLLVTDLKMPQRSGLDLARAAAAMDPPVPSVLVSSHIGSNGLPPGLFVAVLPKPTEAPALVAAVQRALSPS